MKFLGGNLSTLAQWVEDDGFTPASDLPDASTACLALSDPTAGACVCLSFDGDGNGWTGGTITAPDGAVSNFATINGGICTNRYDNSGGATAITNINAPGGITWPGSISYGTDDVAAAEAVAVAAQLATDIAAVDAGKADIKTSRTILTVTGTFAPTAYPRTAAFDPAAL